MTDTNIIVIYWEIVIHHLSKVYPLFETYVVDKIVHDKFK